MLTAYSSYTKSTNITQFHDQSHKCAKEYTCTTSGDLTAFNCPPLCQSDKETQHKRKIEKAKKGHADSCYRILRLFIKHNTGQQNKDKSDNQHQARVNPHRQLLHHCGRIDIGNCKPSQPSCNPEMILHLASALFQHSVKLALTESRHDQKHNKDAECRHIAHSQNPECRNGQTCNYPTS